MTNGRDALRQIDASIADARREMARAGDAATDDARALADLDQRELALLQGLAEIRLGHIQEGAGGSLGDIDREAARLIEAHEQTVAEFGAAREAAARELDRLEGARAAEIANVDIAIHRHEEAAAATRERLEADPSYRSQAAALEELGAMAQRAETKLSIAREDRALKGAAYEADPLFHYLHARKFGTKAYRAFPLFVLPDRWVAGLIGYRKHRINYEKLCEIPERLAEHLERLRSEAEKARTAIEQCERYALEKDGVGELRDAVAAARARVEGHDHSIEAAEARHRELAARAAAAAEGEAGPFAEARKLVAGALAKIALPHLKLLAAETANHDDDRLIDALIRLRRERMELEDARIAANASERALSRRLSELEDVRRRFKGARFDSPYSEFSGKDVLALLLAEFLRGAIGRDDLWRRIEGGHKTRRRDWDNDFGGDEWRGGFGLPDNWGGPMGGGWGSGAGPRNPRPPRMPRVRTGSGFRTGGVFRGGGGFKTGGGF